MRPSMPQRAADTTACDWAKLWIQSLGELGRCGGPGLPEIEVKFLLAMFWILNPSFVLSNRELTIQFTDFMQILWAYGPLGDVTDKHMVATALRFTWIHLVFLIFMQVRKITLWSWGGANWSGAPRLLLGSLCASSWACELLAFVYLVSAVTHNTEVIESFWNYVTENWLLSVLYC